MRKLTQHDQRSNLVSAFHANGVAPTLSVGPTCAAGQHGNFMFSFMFPSL